MKQGILGVFLREPLLDWQREARVLQGVRRSKGGSLESRGGAADAHISQKARALEAFLPNALTTLSASMCLRLCYLLPPVGAHVARSDLCMALMVHHPAQECYQ